MLRVVRLHSARGRLGLTWSVRRRTTLLEAEIDGMLRVHRTLYERVDASRFRADLQDKDEAILLTEPDGTIRGYTTLSVRRSTNEQPSVLFSGDTGVERCAWGDPGLQVGWLASALRWHDALGPLDWLLLAGGPRTYRYLPLFFIEHWPRHDRPTPPLVADRIEQLAGERYGERYQIGPARAGIVLLGEPPLRGDLDVTRPDDPCDRFFRAANPGWTRGDELVCLTSVDRANLTPAGMRILRRAMCS